SSRPIQRLKLERQANVDLSAAAKSGGITKVQGDKLVVAAPNKINKPVQAIAPPRVKTKVAQPKIEKGWTGVANAAQLKEKIKTENPNIPPPTGAAGAGQAPGGISPTVPPAGITSPAPTAPTTPFERGRGKGRAAGTPPTPGQTGAALGAPEASQPPGKHKGQFERGVVKPSPEQPGGAANQLPQGQYRGPGPEQTAAPPTGATPYEGRAGKQRGQGAFAQPNAPPTTGVAPGETQGGKQRGQGAYGQPGGAPGGGSSAGGGQEKPKGGKKKGEQGSPTPPGPQ